MTTRKQMAITEADLHEEWHKLLVGDTPRLPEGVGYTVYELMKKFNFTSSYDAVRHIIKRLERQGKIKRIGVRSGRGASVVYEIVK